MGAIRLRLFTGPNSRFGRCSSRRWHRCFQVNAKNHKLTAPVPRITVRIVGALPSVPHMLVLSAKQNPGILFCTMATKKSSTRGRGKVRKVMHEYKEGTLKSGGRKKVKSRKQAVAIALSEARQSGANIPDKRSAAKKKAAKKSSAKKTTTKKATKKSTTKKSGAKKSASKKR
jgi:hypothetical protein